MKKTSFLLAMLLLGYGVRAQTITFGDSNLLNILVYGTGVDSAIAKDINGNNIRIDTNNDMQIQVSEALNVYQLNIRLNSSPAITLVDSMVGIEYFTNLRVLDCSSHYLDNLNVTALVNLQELYCNYTYVDNLNIANLPQLRIVKCAQINATSLNLSGLTSLEVLDCNNSDITSLDFASCPNLKSFSFAYANYLTSLNNLSGLQHLEEIAVYGANMPTLTLSNLPSLKKAWCYDNETNVLNLSGLPALEELYCQQNHLTTLPLIGLDNLIKLECWDNLIAGNFNVSDKINLRLLKCYNNQITRLFTRNGYVWTTFDIYFYGNAGLNYICADDSQFNFFRNKVSGSGIPINNVEINSYCSFMPGGVYYTVQGHTRFDADSNGCSPTDLAMGHQIFNISGVSSNGSIIANESGAYNFSLRAGNYTITPQLELPQYFNLSPNNVSIVFPGTNPILQDFCLTANGTHPDLEVYIVPVTVARPGFDATYTIHYRNKGTTLQSGVIQLQFDDSRLDLVSVTPATAAQTPSNLSWNFVNLQPFESRAITVVFNLNTPMESPPVSGGHIFDFYASISSPATDDTPADNVFDLRQEVVNSFDPNDKTCLEGATIGTQMVGKYLHYMIRFENTGTANAQNIVVKDMIDLQRFDISSLVPLAASHDFTTRIEGTKVEFIFENIQLPFDDAHNDGYVSFKIKSLPSLVVGNTLSNTAGIYFDYNFPVVTDPAVTTIAALAVNDFEFSDAITIYPNPADTVLNLNAKSGTRIESVEIFNLLGQPVKLIVGNAVNAPLDVSDLARGSYLLKVKTNSGNSSTKFVKK